MEGVGACRVPSPSSPALPRPLALLAPFCCCTTEHAPPAQVNTGTRAMLLRHGMKQLSY